MPVWYINSEVMRHLWMRAGILGQTASSLRLAIWQRKLLRTFLPFLAQSHPTGMKLEQDPFRLIQSMLLAPGAQREQVVRSASQPLQQSLPKTGACECSLDKETSQHPRFGAVFALSAVHTVGPSEFSCTFKWLRGLQTQQTGNLCDDTKGADNKRCTISQICKKGWIMERWLKPPKSLRHVCYIWLCSNHKDSAWLQKRTEPLHSAWGDFFL